MRLVLSAVILLCGTGASAQESSPATAMQAAVEQLSGILETDQFEQLRLPFNDEARLTWSFLPGVRKGLSMKGLEPAQQDAVRAVVQTGLSESGYATVETIRQLDEVLRRLSMGVQRDPDLYFLAVFGTPGDAPWAVRFEGHHVSLNWTVAGGKVIASTPQFLGANPAEVRAGDLMLGTRALAVEEDLGRSLVVSLDDAQRNAGVVDPVAPPEILSRMDIQAGMQADSGIAYGALSQEQQGLLISLIEHYARVQAPPLAEERLRKVHEDGLEKVKFAWMGGLAPGEGHYYRIQGPGFLIEYDNTQNNANHIHTVWRDFQGDFGRDILKEHYQQHAGHDHGHDH